MPSVDVATQTVSWSEDGAGSIPDAMINSLEDDGTGWTMIGPHGRAWIDRVSSTLARRAGRERIAAACTSRSTQVSVPLTQRSARERDVVRCLPASFCGSYHRECTLASTLSMSEGIRDGIVVGLLLRCRIAIP